MSTPPSATPAVPQKSGIGCLLAVILFPVVILAGIVVGTVLNRSDDDSTGEQSATVDEGTIDGTKWRVDAVRDVEGDTCAFLYQDGEQLTGGCEIRPDDATFAERTVVFGKAAPGDTTVTVELSDGTTVDIPTVTVEGIDGRYYAKVVPGDVDAVG